MRLKNKIFIISGPSGAGKTTIAKEILKDIKGIKRNISLTSRAKRKKERNGMDYRFVTKAKFRKFIEQDAFLEWAEVLGNYYGTLRRDVESFLKQGKDVLLCIDVQGAKQVREKVSHTVSIFILPPSFEKLKGRLFKRGEIPREVARRITLAKKEVKEVYEYDYFVINDVLKKAVKLIKCIIYAERSKIDRRNLKGVLDVICKTG